MGIINRETYLKNGFIDADHVVIFSGGCDSTLLLNEVAAQYATTDKPIVALSIDHYLIDKNKREIEKQRQEAIIAELRRRKMRVEHYTITVDADANIYTSKQGPTQAYMWLTAIVPYIKNDAHVYLGYIRSDDATMLLQDIIKLKDVLCRFLGKNFYLEVPYVNTHKERIIQELMDADLYDLTWYCELPNTDKPCGYCVPCETHQRAILTLATKGNERAITMLPPHIKIVKKHLSKNRKVTLK